MQPFISFGVDVLDIRYLVQKILVFKLHHLDIFRLKPQDTLGGKFVKIAVGSGKDQDDLLLYRHGHVLILLQNLDEPLPSSDLCLSHLIEVGTEFYECFEGPELCEIEAEAAGNFSHRFNLGMAADARDGDTDVDGGSDAGVEEARLQIDLAVCNGNDVGRDIRGNVAGLRLYDRKSRQTSGALRFTEL